MENYATNEPKNKMNEPNSDTPEPILSADQLHAKYRAITSQPFEQKISAQSVYQLLSATALNHPEKPAISFQLSSKANSNQQTLNWREVHQKTTQAANFFRALGVGDNDVIAYLLPSLNETVITFLGGMTAGIVAPINPLLETEQISALLKETKAKVLVTLKAFPKTDLAQKAREVVREANCVETIVEIDLHEHTAAPLKWLVPFIRPKVSNHPSIKVLDFHSGLNQQNANQLDFKECYGNRICAYFHTGGTTGMPKITQHSQIGALYNGWVSAEILLQPSDSILCPLPLFHVFANYPVLMGAIVSGAHLIMVTPSGYRGDGVIKHFWQLIERWRCTVFITVPTAAALLMQQKVNADISSLRFAISGSAPFPPKLFEEFKSHIKVNILEGYGMTEATCLVSCNPADAAQKVGSVGAPIPYTDVKIFNIDTENIIASACQTNEIGEVCISSPGVIPGYTYTNPEKNEQLYINEKYLRSGDLGRIDEDGYLWLTGRAKDLIIRGGHNIDPAIIEDALAAHPAIAFSGAIGQPDSKAGELPCAYVELRENAQVSVAELMAFAEQHVPEDAAAPKYIEILSELPKTAIGKVFKPALRKLAITRVYNTALKEAKLNAEVSAVIKDETYGQIVEINGDKSLTQQDIDNALGNYIIATRLVN